MTQTMVDIHAAKALREDHGHSDMKDSMHAPCDKDKHQSRQMQIFYVFHFMLYQSQLVNACLFFFFFFIKFLIIL